MDLTFHMLETEFYQEFFSSIDKFMQYGSANKTFELVAMI